MRKDAGTYGDAQRLEQLGWMFFLKIFDDREKEMELLRDNYKSPLPQHLRWSNWATGRGRHHRRRAARLRQQHAPAQAQVPDRRRRQDRGLIRMAFEDANNYMKNGTLMRQVINKINGIDFNASDDRHMFGDIYEKLLKDLQSAGNAGEFYTPRAVTQFIVDRSIPALAKPSSTPPAAPAASSSAPSSTCASRPRPRPTSAPSRTASPASRRSTCRTSCA
jgi:type I restriction enzyme M protein